MESKERIYCHRAFKKLPAPPVALSCLRVIALAAPFIVLVILFSTDLTRLFAQAVQSLLSPVLPSIRLVERPHSLLQTLYLADYWGRYPSPQFSLLTAFISAWVGLAVLRIKRIPKSVGIYLAFICCITFCSAVFFLLFPDRFPYAMADFSYLYIIIEVGIWCVIPVLMALSIVLLPMHISEQYAIIAVTMLYSILFGLIRYVLFFYLLHTGSYILMATMFIAFDPPLDTFYILGIYALYVSWVGKRQRAHREAVPCS